MFYLFTFSTVCGTTSINKSSVQDTDMKEIQEPSLPDINKGMFTLKSYRGKYNYYCMTAK